MTNTPRIDIDDPDVDMDDSERLFYRGVPFTGEVTEHLGQYLVSSDAYVNGRKDGPSFEWYKDGTRRSQGTVRSGLPVGEFKEWHPNGSLASVKVFAENGLTLLEHNEWDESGNARRGD